MNEFLRTHWPALLTAAITFPYAAWKTYRAYRHDNLPWARSKGVDYITYSDLQNAVFTYFMFLYSQTVAKLYRIDGSIITSTVEFGTSLIVLVILLGWVLRAVIRHGLRHPDPEDADKRVYVWTLLRRRGIGAADIFFFVPFGLATSYGIDVYRSLQAAAFALWSLAT